MARRSRSRRRRSSASKANPRSYSDLRARSVHQQETKTPAQARLLRLRALRSAAPARARTGWHEAGRLENRVQPRLFRPENNYWSSLSRSLRSC